MEECWWPRAGRVEAVESCTEERVILKDFQDDVGQLLTEIIVLAFKALKAKGK